MQKGYNMRIKIENFAKIKKADIEINGITVIAGENNTGKSTIGKALYSMFDSFYNISNKVNYERSDRISAMINDLGYFDDEISDYVYVELDCSYDDFYQEIKDVNLMETSKEKALLIYASIISNHVSDNIFDYINSSDLFENIYTVMSINDEDIRKAIVSRVFSNEFNSQYMPLFSNDNSDTMISLKIKDNYINLKFSDTIDIERFIPLIYQVVYIDSPLLLNVTGERTQRRYAGRYSMHDVKLINKLNYAYKSSIMDDAIYSDVIIKIKKMINNIIHGDFVIENRRLMFREDGIEKPINISNLSTGIKSFATLLRILDNGYIIKNSLLILDEPEVNLHPKWQLKYAELLVFMQKELNLHILLNTHSPYFINAIEVYSAKYEIVDKCKYYLASLDDNKALFEDVTLKIDNIYEKLASPFQTLTDIEDTLNEDIEF